jgi:serine/threonine-protein kinase HipA
MRRARVLVHSRPAGVLEELDERRGYRFAYDPGYDGPAVSLTMPPGDAYTFAGFPPFFDGLLPEGVQLEGLLRQRKIDRDDLFAQLVAVGGDLVGAVTVEALET